MGELLTSAQISLSLVADGEMSEEQAELINETNEKITEITNRIKITENSVDIYAADEETRVASYGENATFYGENSTLIINDDGLNIQDLEGHDFFDVYKKPGGETYDETFNLGNIESKNYAFRIPNLSIINELYMKNGSGRIYYFLNDNRIGYISSASGDIAQVGGGSAGFTSVSPAEFSGYPILSYTYIRVGTWALDGHILRITSQSRIEDAKLIVVGITNSETSMHVYGSVRESIEAVDIALDTSSGTISGVSAVRVGQVVSLYFSYASSNDWGNSGERVATILEGPKPAQLTKGVGRYGGRSFIVNITSDGDISMQNCGSSLSSGKIVGFEITYITDDDATYISSASSGGSSSSGGSGIDTAQVRELIETYDYITKTEAQNAYQPLPEDEAIAELELNDLLAEIFD